MKHAKIIIISLLCLGLGFLGGMEFKAYQIRKIFSDTAKEISNSSTNTEPTKNEPGTLTEAMQNKEYTTMNHSIGEEVSLATVKFVVNKAEETQALSGGFGTPAIAKQGTKFVVLEITITNIGKAGFMLNVDDGLRLIDQKDREFTAYPDTIGKVNNYLEVRTLSPGVPETGIVVYEIPNDSTSYSFVSSKGGTKEVHKVILK